MNYSLSTQIHDKYGINAIPGGKKVECPSCGKQNAFSIMRTDLYGRCWKCGKEFRAKKFDTPSMISSIMNDIKKTLVNELIERSSTEAKRAWAFLLDERSLDEETIMNHDIGVVPKGFSVDIYFERAIENIKSQIKQLEKEYDREKCFAPVGNGLTLR